MNDSEDLIVEILSAGLWTKDYFDYIHLSQLLIIPGAASLFRTNNGDEIRIPYLDAELFLSCLARALKIDVHSLEFCDMNRTEAIFRNCLFAGIEKQCSILYCKGLCPSISYDEKLDMLERASWTYSLLTSLAILKNKTIVRTVNSLGIHVKELDVD